MSKPIARIRLLLALCAAVLCWGCLVVPLRVPTKTRTPSGELKQKVDPSFISTGVTTREEVVQKLGWIDTGVRDDHFFFGRWVESTWGVVWAAGGYGAGGAGWNRNWNVHNLLLDFDEKGVVRQITSFPDKQILEMLAARSLPDGDHAKDEGIPIEISVEYRRGPKTYPGALSLGHDAFVFLADRQTKPKERYDFTTAAANISHLSLSGTVKEHPEKVDVTIHFTDKTPVGRKFNVRVGMPGAAALVKYLQQNAHTPNR